MTDTNQNILLLKNLVEETIGRKLKTTTDFSCLSLELKEKTGIALSISTLKRLWGYVGGYQNVRESTLDVLSLFVGYSNFLSFVKKYCESELTLSSQRMFLKPLYAKDIALETEIEIRWNPGRVCRLRYLGEEKFVVIYSEKSKLTIGDTFVCKSFYKNQPCFLEEFIHEDEKPCGFVVGNKDGLTHIEQLCKA